MIKWLKENWWIEKILEKLEKRKDRWTDLANQSNFDGYAQEEKEYLLMANEDEKLIQIVQEVAKEYGKDTNVRSNEYEKGYEDGFEEGAESVRALAPYEDDWIPCSGCSDCQHKECKHYGKV